jgi:hypothetical protein
MCRSRSSCALEMMRSYRVECVAACTSYRTRGFIGEHKRRYLVRDGHGGPVHVEADVGI